MPTINASVGGLASNSYETLAEANTYFDERLPLAPPWLASGASNVAALIMATRVLDMMAVGHKRLLHDSCDCQYYLTSRRWTGAPTTTTQRLAWPRTGMYDRNGNAIASSVIPQELKDAESELAGQLLGADTTLDNPVIIGGITSVKAGSVAVTFKDMIDRHVLPNAVISIMPNSWFTDELVESVLQAEFDVV